MKRQQEQTTETEILKGRSSRRPIKTLPTPRITFARQLEILRAYASLSGQEGKSVSNKAVAELVKMVEGTVSLGNAFFTDVNLLERRDDGYAPAKEVKEYFTAFRWTPDTATHHLRPLIEQTWFAQKLLPKLAMRPIAEEEALTDLAQMAMADPEYKAQLKMLLEYLQSSGLLVRDGDLLSASTLVGRPSANDASPTPPPGTNLPPVTPAKPRAANVIAFDISVHVDMNQLSGWDAEKIRTFFAGVAQVLAAKGNVDSEQT